MGHPASLQGSRQRAWSAQSSEREQIDLTIDSGCAACALPVKCCIHSSDARVEQNSSRVHDAANAEKFRELGFTIPTLKFQTSDVWNLKFSVKDKLPKPLVAACKVVAAGNRIVLQPRNQGGSFIEDVRSKQETNL